MAFVRISAEETEGAAARSSARHKSVVALLKKRRPKELDRVVQEWTRQAFDEFDCILCARCCASLGPRVTSRDVNTLSRALRVKPAVFEETYLRRDEDGDLVFQSMPCPFLDEDNLCLVYEERPRACQDYPHTHHPRFYRNLTLSLKNARTCPIVFEILERLTERYLDK